MTAMAMDIRLSAPGPGDNCASEPKKKCKTNTLIIPEKKGTKLDGFLSSSHPPRPTANNPLTRIIFISLFCSHPFLV